MYSEYDGLEDMQDGSQRRRGIKKKERKRGRPRSYGTLERMHFWLPCALNARIVELARALGISKGELIRGFLIDVLSEPLKKDFDQTVIHIYDRYSQMPEFIEETRIAIQNEQEGKPIPRLAQEFKNAIMEADQAFRDSLIHKRDELLGLSGDAISVGVSGCSQQDPEHEPKTGLIVEPKRKSRHVSPKDYGRMVAVHFLIPSVLKQRIEHDAKNQSTTCSEMARQILIRGFPGYKDEQSRHVDALYAVISKYGGLPGARELVLADLESENRRHRDALVALSNALSGKHDTK
jgi:hypothetical protein